MAKVNKKAWILAQDNWLSASELVRLAREKGFRLEPNYVHMTRYHARKRAAAVGVLKSWATTDAVTGKPVRKRSDAAVQDGVVAARAVQVQFMILIRRAGTINARKWLSEIRAAEI